VKYGAANAVLTGDALMIHAFQLLAEFGNSAVSLELAKSAGSMGVIAGQTEDLAAENKEPSPGLVEYIHFNKTAILIRAAVRMGAIIGGADESELECFSRFGEKTGLAFQIADDILDQTSSDEMLGKPTGSDMKKHKLTYPSVHGMDAAKIRVVQLTQEATAALDPLSRDTAALRSIADHLENRQF
jgi:geranylgeranyl diphosphate synthase type II